MELNTLADLLSEQLLKLYNSEQQISQALPSVAEAAYSSDLRRAFIAHNHTVSRQIERLEKIFVKLGLEHNGEWCIAMEGLIKEIKDYLRFGGSPGVKDSALITATQRIELYEITGYNASLTIASELGYDDIAEMLEKTLDEECAVEKQLSSLAKGGFFSKEREEPF